MLCSKPEENTAMNNIYVTHKYVHPVPPVTYLDIV